jgi:hypothetical protein
MKTMSSASPRARMRVLLRRACGPLALCSAVAAVVLWLIVAALDPGESGACSPGLNSLPFDGSVARAPMCMSVAGSGYIALDFVLILALLTTGICGAEWIRIAVDGDAPGGSRTGVGPRIGQLLVLGYAVADVAENIVLLTGPDSATALRGASVIKLAAFALALVVLVAAAVGGGRRASSAPLPGCPEDIANLLDQLADPGRYRVGMGTDVPASWVRKSRKYRHDLDAAAGKAFLDRSCDVTMRGGTTSGVIYPLAICALAEKYVFRNIGGASAGAIAAAATAAAEVGRFAGPAGPARIPAGPAVAPGFAGLAQLVSWLVAPPDATDPPTSVPGEHWRLARLFQPGRPLRPLFRLFMAAMQDRRKTGIGRARAFAVAIMGFRWWTFVTNLFAIGWFLLGPAVLWQLFGPRPLAGPDVVRPVVVVLLLMLLAFLASRPLDRRPWLAVIVLLLPTLFAAVTPGLLVGQLPAVLVVSLANAAVLLLLVSGVLGVAVKRLVGATFVDNGLGMVPGVAGHADSRVVRMFDRLAGVPDPGRLPALVDWLADRIDDLAGVPVSDGGAHRCLTVGQLWAGSVHDVPTSKEWIEKVRTTSGARVVNLALMTTDISEGRPFRLPFVSATSPQNVDEESWLFCELCLRAVLPARAVDHMCEHAAEPAIPLPDLGGSCPRHPAGPQLRSLPEPEHVPVVFLARMSMSLPGVLAAVPLYRYHRIEPRLRYDGWGRCSEGSPDTGAQRVLRVHWMSDGGITSNFPIHLFDNLLPLWPTFGLNLQPYPEQATDPHGGAAATDPSQDDGYGEDLYFPRQETVGSATFIRRVCDAAGFGAAISGTFMSWRDTMQSELPGFQGRIVNVRQAASEGGTNFFMSRRTVHRLAVRGYHAGRQIVDRFCPDGDDGLGQTGRYRWIRLRIAAREYRQLSADARERTDIYQDLLAGFRVANDMENWFDDVAAGLPDPRSGDLSAALELLGNLGQPEGNGAPAGPLSPSISPRRPPVNIDLRAMPPE